MNKKVCIILSDYYVNISKNLLNGALKTLGKNGFRNVKVVKVPGVFEIPVIISKNKSRYDAFVSLGCVIKGETPHFELISQSAINALMHLSITYNKPIGNGIIVCLNKKQALARSSHNKKNKGSEAAQAICSVLKVL